MLRAELKNNARAEGEPEWFVLSPETMREHVEHLGSEEAVVAWLRARFGEDFRVVEASA